MDLKEYLKIIKKNAHLFVAIILTTVLVVFGYFYLRPISYTTSLILNITRTGTQQTDQFKYDNFYRLQADEKFTETVVEWLKSPRIVADIYKNAEINTSTLNLRDLSKAINPEKMSSQLILVSFSAPTIESSKKIANSIVKSVNDNTTALNKDQKDSNWFEVLSEEPVIVKDFVKPSILLFASLVFGMFLGFWVVMVKYYLE